MLTKRLFLDALLLTVLVIITGCATTGKSKDPLSRQIRRANDICLRFGYAKGSDDYNLCIYKNLGLKNILASLKINGEVSEDLEIECRKTTVTGSRLKRNICTTTSEWDTFDKINRKNVDEFEELFRKGTRTIKPDEDSVGRMPR